VLLIGRDGRASLVERNFGPEGVDAGERRIDLQLAAAGRCASAWAVAALRSQPRRWLSCLSVQPSRKPPSTGITAPLT
jgi:hypothetical protein